MTSAANITWLQQTGRRYLIGTPKSDLKKFATQIVDARDWQSVREGVEAKLCAGPDGKETFVLVRSEVSITSLLAKTHVATDPGKLSMSAAGTTASLAMVSSSGSLRAAVSRSPSGVASVADQGSPPWPRAGSTRGAGSEPQRNKDSTSGR